MYDWCLLIWAPGSVHLAGLYVFYWVQNFKLWHMFFLAVVIGDAWQIGRASCRERV